LDRDYTMSAKICFLRLQFILICSILSVSVLTASDISSNPHEYRRSLHSDYSASRSATATVLPEIKSGEAVLSNSVMFSDVLISESVSPANFTQDNSSLAALTGGRFAAVWEDNRLGTRSIYIQIFDASGNPLSSNQALITSTITDLSDPVITPDASGNFYVIWREENGGYLQAARFDSDAAVLTDVFYISDTDADDFAGEFDAACLPNGRLAVTWESYVSGDYISLQIFDTDGTEATSITTVNSEAPPEYNRPWSPQVAVSDNSIIAVTWEDYRNGGIADIYIRLYNASVTALGTEKLLSDVSARGSARYLPELTYCSADGFVAGWVDLRDGENIYLQCVLENTTLNGSNVLLSTGTLSYSNWEVALGHDVSGYLLASWTVYGLNNTINLQKFTSGLTFDGSAIEASDADDYRRLNSTVTGNQDGLAMVLWTDLSTGSADIFGNVIDASDVESGYFAVNDDDTGSPSNEPAVTAWTRYEWAVVFSDQRRDGGDIMLQRLDVDGALIGSNRLINTDAVGGVQRQPAIAGNPDFMCVSWTDSRTTAEISGQNIICSFIRPDYNLTSDIVVNDDYAGSALHYESDCSVNDDGYTLIVWTDTRDGLPLIYGQLFDVDFGKIGDNFLIGSTTAGEIGQQASVSLTDDGQFAVLYKHQLTSGSSVIRCKRVTSDGTVTTAFSFTNFLQTGYDFDTFDAVSYTGSTYIIWRGYDISGSEIFLTVYDSTGVNSLANTAVMDNSAAAPEDICLAVDTEGYIVVSWLDHRSGQARPYRQIYDPSYSPVEANTAAYQTAAAMMQNPATAAYAGRAVFVWADARADGYNIYASQEFYSPSDADDNDTPLPLTYDLSQNFPNPFNPETIIKFTLPQASDISLTVYNLLGQKVTGLADGFFTAGQHSVRWDGTDNNGTRVASGIYFYRLTGDNFVQTHKMILMK